MKQPTKMSTLSKSTQSNVLKDQSSENRQKSYLDLNGNTQIHSDLFNEKQQIKLDEDKHNLKEIQSDPVFTDQGLLNMSDGSCQPVIITDQPKQNTNEHEFISDSDSYQIKLFEESMQRLSNTDEIMRNLEKPEIDPDYVQRIQSDISMAYRGFNKLDISLFSSHLGLSQLEIKPEMYQLTFGVEQSNIMYDDDLIDEFSEIQFNSDPFDEAMKKLSLSTLNVDDLDVGQYFLLNFKSFFSNYLFKASTNIEQTDLQYKGRPNLPQKPQIKKNLWLYVGACGSWSQIVKPEACCCTIT